MTVARCRLEEDGLRLAISEVAAREIDGIVGRGKTNAVLLIAQQLAVQQRALNDGLQVR